MTRARPLSRILCATIGLCAPARAAAQQPPATAAPPASVSALTETAQGPYAAELRRIVDSVRTAFAMPAMGAAIVAPDGRINVAVAGTRRASGGAAVTVDDRWHIGSNLKAVVGMLAGIGVDQGKIAWTSTVEEVFPELAARVGPEYRGLTLKEMLAHSAGFPRDPLGLPLSGTPREKRDSVVRWAVTQPPAAARGSFFYSNTDYIVAGAMLERAFGVPFEQALTERIFTPLGITTAGFGPQAAEGSTTQPVAHRVRPDGTWQEVEALDNPDYYASAGGVHMPLEAWALIVREVLRADAGRSTLLSAATGRVLTTPATRLNATDGYALGWITTSRTWGNGRVLTHNGSNTGNFSVAWLAPERGFAILVTTNAFDTVAPTGRAFRSTDALAARLIILLTAPPTAP